MPDSTVGTASKPSFDESQRSRVVHYKGEPIECTQEQLDRRFWDKVNKTPDGCWEWTGTRYPHGYGKMSWGKRTSLYPHRVSYEIHKGPIPAGLHIDHLCRNRACCNPAHLEAVTCAENIRRSPIASATINAAKTHCAHGHEYTAENTLWINGGRGRVCRSCRRLRERQAAARKKGLVAPDARDAGACAPPNQLKTECPQGHPYDDTNTYVDPKGSRRCRTCARADMARYNAKRSTRRQG